jgi:hypothetical protein
MVPTFESRTLLGSECTYLDLAAIFRGASEFVVQSNISGGGCGTRVLRSECDNLSLSDNERYLVSPLVVDNIPVNIHAVIFDDQTILTPGSIQVIHEHNGKLLYRGADFITYGRLEEKVRNEFEGSVLRLCHALRDKGYRGICGFDAMVIDGKAFIVEANNRFQASTALINSALADSGLPTVNELNLMAFRHENGPEGIEDKIGDVSVPFSSYAFIGGDDEHHLSEVLSTAFHADNSICQVVTDGYSLGQPTDPEAYLCKILLNTSITEIIGGNKVLVDPAVTGFKQSFPNVAGR